MSALQADDGEVLVNKMPAYPFRRRTGLQTDASKTISPSVERTPHGLRFTAHLTLPQHLTSLANDANGYRVERDIQSCIKAHADLLLPGRLRASGERRLPGRGQALGDLNRIPDLFREAAALHVLVLSMGQNELQSGLERGATSATLTWVDWFNNRRLLEPISNIPPAEAEERHYAILEEPAMAA